MSNRTSQPSNPPGPSVPSTGGASLAPAARRPRSISLRTRLIAALLLIALIPTAVLGYWQYTIRKSSLDTVTQQTLQLKAGHTAAAVNNFIQTNLVAITAQAQLPQLYEYTVLAAGERPGSKQKLLLEATFRALINGTSPAYITSYALLDSRGINLVDTVKENVGRDEGSYSYFYEALWAEKPYVSPVLFDPVNAEPVLIFSSVVRGPQEQVMGVLRVRYNAAVLSQLIDRPSTVPGDGSFALLLDDNFMILAHGDAPELAFKSIIPFDPGRQAQLQRELRLPAEIPASMVVPLPSLRQALLNAGAQPYPVTQFGPAAAETGTAAISQVELQPWSVVFIQPQRIISSQNTNNIFTVVMVLGVLVVLLFFAAFSTADLLTNPITRLVGLAHQVAGGAWGIRLPAGSHDEVARLGVSFNSLSSQLQDITGRMDAYIAERTGSLENMIRSMELSSQISRQITTILDLDQLLEYIVNRVQAEFKFYHTQVYLVEKETGDLVIAEGAGELGRRLKEQGHRLAAGRGIVGTVASTNEYFLSNNVAQALNFVANQWLPHTRSELAVPLRVGDRVVGVLDVQSDQLNRFRPEDITVIQAIANQTAVAIDNARLLAETQVALQQVERLNRRLTREGWQEFAEETASPGYRYATQPNFIIGPAPDAWLPPMGQAALQRQLVKQVIPANGEPPRVEVAVPLVLRGEVIGVLGVKRQGMLAWAEEEEEVVEAVANQVALALENARLAKEQEKTIVQLKDIDRLKSEFLTSMSHELRTPLNSIIGFADVLLQGIDGDLSDNAMIDIQAIYNSGQHLLALINDILDLSKIEAGKMELIREPIRLNDTIDIVLSSSSSLVKNKPVQILADAALDLPLLYADKLRLKQILLNLVSNAVKFTNEGSITIGAVIKPDAPGEMFISVKDTGIGIPPHMLDKVFERFRQVDSSSTRKVGGTGLGLAICRQLVEMHGGRIGVTSELNIGSTFYFTIPLFDSGRE